MGKGPGTKNKGKHSHKGIYKRARRAISLSKVSRNDGSGSIQWMDNSFGLDRIGCGERGKGMVQCGSSCGCSVPFVWVRLDWVGFNTVSLRI